MGGQRHRRQKIRLFERQDGKCHWCGEQMLDPAIIYEDKQPDNLATLDHLDSRLSEERGKHSDNIRRVLACRRCNGNRGAKEQAQLSEFELWRRSGHKRQGMNQASLYKPIHGGYSGEDDRIPLKYTSPVLHVRHIQLNGESADLLITDVVHVSVKEMSTRDRSMRDYVRKHGSKTKTITP